MKSSGSLPSLNSISAFLHSAMPLHLATLISVLSPLSFRHSTTASVTPPPLPKRFPNTLASWLVFSSGSSSTPFARIMARISPKVSTKSAFPSMLLSCASDFLAMQGPINTVTVSGSFAFSILDTAHIGETVVEMFPTSSGKCFLI